MKKVKFSWTCIFALFVLFVAWIFHGCGGGGGSGPAAGPATAGESAKIAAQIVDAKDDSTVLSTANGGPAGGFDVTFYANGKTLKTVNTTTGVATYAANVGADTAVSVEVIPKDASGKKDSTFLSNSTSLTTDSSGYATGKVRVVSRNNLPSGAAIGAGAATADSNGAIKTAFSLTAVPIPAGTPTASISLPAGTILKNAAGQPLTGTLTVLLVYFPSTSDGTSPGYPGGPYTMMQDGNTSGEFITAGFLLIEIMDGSGKLASTFTASGTHPEMIMEISASMTNPNTGDPVAVGDIVPLWSFNMSKGTWTSEGNKTVESGGSTGLRVRFNLAHLSYWAIAWMIPPHCTGKINFTGNTAPINLILSGKGFGNVIYQLANNPQAIVPFVPSDIPITIKAYAYGEQVKINGKNSITVTDWCSRPGNTLDLSITIPGATSRTVTAKYYCPTDFSYKKSAVGIPVLICKKTSKGYSQCDPVGWTDSGGAMSYGVIDASKVAVAMYKSQLYEADGSGIIYLPNSSVCPTGSGSGTGMGEDF